MKVMRDFKETFREDVTCENSTSHRKTGFNLSLYKMHFLKNRLVVSN